MVTEPDDEVTVLAEWAITEQPNGDHVASDGTSTVRARSLEAAIDAAVEITAYRQEADKETA